MERGEGTLRSNIVYVYRINLPHNKLLLASVVSRNVSEFYTAIIELCLGRKWEDRTYGGATELRINKTYC